MVWHSKAQEHSMRRSSSILLLALLVILAIVTSTRYVALRNQAARKTASVGALRDSVARLDSAAQAEARQDIDTMCIASRIGLPCDPH
jgi:hypothetical protein